MKKYKDNAMNRTLGRAGLPIGSKCGQWDKPEMKQKKEKPKKKKIKVKKDKKQLPYGKKRVIKRE